MLQLIQAYKDYQLTKGQVRALQPTDLCIQQGEIFGLIGHSGAGKSTLLRLLNLLEKPSGGQLLWQGQEVTQLQGSALSGYRQQFGMIFQHFNLLSSQKVWQNIALPLALAGNLDAKARQARVEQLLARVGLTEQADKYPSQLSGGQKQRVGIARALACQPPVLLCDEATSALDPQTTSQILNLLSELNQELGLTIVLITHEMDVIRQVCDRVAVMDQGRIVEQGKVEQVFLRPQHPTSQGFVAQALPEERCALEQQVSGLRIRLSYLGEQSYAPLLSQITKATEVDFSILAGRIDRLRHQPYGQLTLALQGKDEHVAQCVAQLSQAGLEVDLL